MSDLLGVAQSDYSNWERGKRDVQFKTFEKICERLDIQMAELLSPPGSPRHQDAPDVTIASDVLDQLSELSAKADVDGPTPFLRSLLSAYGDQHVRTLKALQSAGHAWRKDAGRQEDAARLAEEQGEQHLKAAQESEKKNP